MSSTEEEMTVYDRIKSSERGHIVFLSICFLLFIIPCLLPDFIDRLIAGAKLTGYSDILTGIIPILAIVIAMVHCKNHKKVRERLRREKRQFESDAEVVEEPYED